VRSEETIINSENVLDGKELLEKISKTKEENFVKVNEVKERINKYKLQKLIEELREQKLRYDLIRYIEQKIEKGWMITVNSLLLP